MHGPDRSGTGAALAIRLARSLRFIRVKCKAGGPWMTEQAEITGYHENRNDISAVRRLTIVDNVGL